MSNTVSRMPALFVGHGSPMNALEDNAFTRGWQEAARRIPRPRVILCVSAHWESRGVYVSSAQKPETIHDFYGFPQTLFDVRYPAPGDPALAQRVTQLIKSAQVHTTNEYGLDHGAWSVLRIMYPQADIPVLQFSLDTAQPGTFHYGLGQELGALRDEGVLILASGNIVHNLRLFRHNDSRPYDWAVRFDEHVAEHIASGHHDGLLGYETLGPDALLAVPTPEHYLPLLYVLAVQRDDDPVEFFNEQIISSISMRSVVIGHA